MVARTFSVTPVYDLLLRGTADTPVGLYHLQMATAEQLCLLHYSPGSITTVKARLKNLADHGFIQADAIPTKFFRSPYYYVLGQKGMRYLEDVGCDISATFRASREGNKHALFIEHTLELNDVLISAALLKRAAPNYRLDSFIHERSLKRKLYKATWKAGTQIQSFTLIPDGFLDFHVLTPDGRQGRMPLVLEHDRGTEEQQHFRRRIRAYIVLLKSGEYQKLFGVRTALTVAFTTFMGEDRLHQMRDWTKAELDSTKEPKHIGTTFLFSNLTRPLDSRQIWLNTQWLTPYDQPPVALLVA